MILITLIYDNDTTAEDLEPDNEGTEDITMPEIVINNIEDNEQNEEHIIAEPMFISDWLDDESDNTETVTTDESVTTDAVQVSAEPEAAVVTEVSAEPVVAAVPTVSSTPAASSSAVSSAPTASSAPAVQVAGAARGGIEGFVDRLYMDALNRNADSSGRSYWINLLNNKSKSGTEVANGFLHSAEFISRDLDNEEFLNTLYMVFFNRTPDGAGFANWMNALENGMTRSEVISGFTSSTEWNNTCGQFGINA